MRTSIRLAPLVLLAVATASHAASHAPCAPVVTGAWIRMTPTIPMGAGFFSLRNPCRTDVVLTGVRTSRFGDASMHETRVEGGISRMRPLPRVVVPAGRRVDFLPGGRHLMLMAPDAKVAPGTKARIELRFEDGRRLPVDFDVGRVVP